MATRKPTTNTTTLAQPATSVAKSRATKKSVAKDPTQGQYTLLLMGIFTLMCVIFLTLTLAAYN